MPCGLTCVKSKTALIGHTSKFNGAKLSGRLYKTPSPIRAKTPCTSQGNNVEHRHWSTWNVKPRPHHHQQECQSNIVECYKSNDSFDKVETNWTCSICFDLVERTKFYGKKLVRYCCQNGNTVAQNGNNVDATFEFVERKMFYDKLVRHCCRFGRQQSRTLLRHCCWCGRGLSQRLSRGGETQR